MGDNSVLNPGVGGDTIATEDITTVGQQDADQALPSPEYKIPRSKIATGPVDKDWGDVGPDAPLHVRDLRMIKVLEDILSELRLMNKQLESGFDR